MNRDQEEIVEDNTTKMLADKRSFLKTIGLSAGVGLAGCLGNSGDDGEYPTDTVEIIVPYSEGGGTDAVARGVAPGLENELETDITINNIAGAGGLQGLGTAYSADPDGYTMGAFNPPTIPFMALAHEPDYLADPTDVTEFKGVAGVTRTAYTIIVGAEYEVEDIHDFIGRYESGEFEDLGVAGTQIPYAMVLRDEVGIPFSQFINYDGAGPAVQAVLSGEVPAAIGAEESVQPAVNDGSADLVAVLPSDGGDIFSDAPTIPGEGLQNIDFAAENWRCYWFPPGTDEERVNIASEAFESALESDEVREWAEQTNNQLRYQSGSEVDEMMATTFDEIQASVDIDEMAEELGAE